MAAVKRVVLATLPVMASRLKAALHNACGSGHWEGEVQLVLDKNTNRYRLELVYDANTGLCPHHRSIIEAATDRWYLGCDLVKDKDGFSTTPCTNCGRLPCERYEKHKEG